MTTAAHHEIAALLQSLKRAHAAKDADALVACYAPGALVYDMAPPLGRRGMGREATARWLATWDGPIALDDAELEIAADQTLAVVTAYNRMRGSQGGEPIDLWFRSTLCLRRLEGRWRIVHDHASVPFYMDGSDRACTDLTPDSPPA